MGDYGMQSSIDFKSEEWQISQWLSKIGDKTVDLQPDFQRYYVWGPKKERGFIDSLLRGYAVPPVWLWEKEDDDEVSYSVIDGQQRLTCIKKYSQNEFFYKETPGSAVKSETCRDAHGRYYDQDKGESGSSGTLEQAEKRAFRRAKIPYVIVQTSDRTAVIEIFQRLNQDSMNLNGQELRNAVFHGEFKKSVYDFVKKMRSKKSFWVTGQRAFDLGKKTDRMDVERNISELYAAIIHMSEAPLNKSDKVDYCYKQFDAVFSDKDKVEKKLKDALDDIQKTMGSSSKFCRNISEVYTLVGLLTKAHKRLGRTLNKKEMKLIRNNLNDFQEKYFDWATEYSKAKTDKKKQKIEASSPTFKQYRDTTQGPIHEKANRVRRETILGDLISPMLDTDNAPELDPRRSFPDSVKDIAWYTSSKGNPTALCADKDCQKEITRDECEFDHVKAWSRGGRSSLDNCQVLCQQCNREKGNR